MGDVSGLQRLRLRQDLAFFVVGAGVEPRHGSAAWSGMHFALLDACLRITPERLNEKPEDEKILAISSS